MKYEDIVSDLKKNIYSPIYFLMGDEPYYIDRITDYIQKNVLTESEKSFNLTVLYGKDTDIGTVINTAKRYPMMASHQVVIVREAQHLKKIEDLVYYAEQPLRSTILVINYKFQKLHKQKKVYKALEKNGVVFHSQKLYDDKIPGWINAFLKAKKYNIEPGAASLLTEYLGNDLNKISNELQKLIITLPADENKITPAHIEKNIGISKDYNNFELQNALTKRNVLKANKIITYFGQNPGQNPITLTITSLYFFFSKVLMYHFLQDKSQRNVAATLKINPFFVKDYQMAARNYNTKKVVDIIGILREYDLKSKGVSNVSTPASDLLKELVYKIMH
jgi:DNA polymerase III subunit delta